MRISDWSSDVCSSDLVGYDGRLSSPQLAQSLREGILSEGTGAIDIGMAPTPLMYFAAHTLKTGSGVAITGSHNPPAYNGFKIMMAGGTLYGTDIQELRQSMAALGPGPSGPMGEQPTVDQLDTHVERHHANVEPAG